MTASALAHLKAEGTVRASLSEYRPLVLLASAGPRRPSELAEELEVTRAAIAQILGRLVSARLVSRRTDRADRRSSVLTLTSKGARVVQAVLAERERRLRPALAALGTDDRRALGAALARLHAALALGRGTGSRESGA